MGSAEMKSGAQGLRAGSSLSDRFLQRFGQVGAFP